MRLHYSRRQVNVPLIVSPKIPVRLSLRPSERSIWKDIESLRFLIQTLKRNWEKSPIEIVTPRLGFDFVE